MPASYKSMKGFIVYPAYYTQDNKTFIQLFGRLENGESFVILKEFKPCLYVKEADLPKLSPLLENHKAEKTSLKTFSGEPVVKIESSTVLQLKNLESSIHKQAGTYEADLKPYFRFIIDNNILGSINIQGDYETSEKINRIYKEPEIKPSQNKISLKILSIDTESDKHSDKLFCIGLYSKNYQKNFMVTDKKIENTISCKTEEECLLKFRDEIIRFDPDVITGWNLINFDLKFLQSLFKKYKIPFDIGRTNDSVSLRIENSFFRQSSADIPGRQVLDALYLIKDPFIQEAPTIRNAKFDNYTLEDVSQALLGKGKLIKGKNRHEEIERLYKTKSHEKLVAYNLQDCRLVYEILEKTCMIDLAIERSLLTGLPLDKLTSSIAAFDSLYIREAKSRSLVSPTTKYGIKESRIKGGYVYSFKPGIYQGVLVMDFKSLYPSIIKTFNIDPSSQLQKKEPGCIESPNKAYFKNQSGILPSILGKLHEEREKAKKEKRELSNYAIKIIMNSFFGVLASPNCRFFNLDMANSITHFGQAIIKLTAEELEKKGHKVIYMDTDSVFIESKIDKHSSLNLGKKVQDFINSFYKDYIFRKYSRESSLELEFKKFYISMMIPKVRGSKNDEAAKKRYAGLLYINGKEELDIVGLEAIRGDWTEAAGEFQRELLLKIFHSEDPVNFIKGYIKEILEGNLDKKLIYRKSIRKSLHEYTKTTPPHVKAARLLDSLDSNIIQYYITLEGPEPVQKLKHKIDYSHYIEKQIGPIASQILSLLGKDFEDLKSLHKQSKLF